MKRVELYGRVRHALMIEGLSQREAARCFGIDPRTVRKMLSYSVPPLCPDAASGPPEAAFIGIIDRILEEPIRIVRRSNVTHRSGFERLRDEYGFTGDHHFSAVSDSAREMFVPLTHPPGHAQVDFGEALGHRRRGTQDPLPGDEPSDACFVKRLSGGDHGGLL